MVASPCIATPSAWLEALPTKIYEDVREILFGLTEIFPGLVHLNEPSPCDVNT